MHAFKIYQHPTHGRQAVRIGYCWPAFFFGFFWMLFHRLWFLALGWIASYAALSTLVVNTTRAGPETGLQAIAYVLLLVAFTILWLVPAFKGNSWREEQLAATGFSQVTVLQADNASQAVAKLSQTERIYVPAIYAPD